MPNEWISVKEKEPCLGSLIYDTNGDISIATEIFTIKTKNGNVYITQNTMDILEVLCAKGDVVEIESVTHITHWMPLPEPPKEGADNAE